MLRMSHAEAIYMNYIDVELAGKTSKQHVAGEPANKADERNYLDAEFVKKAKQSAPMHRSSSRMIRRRSSVNETRGGVNDVAYYQRVTAERCGMWRRQISLVL